MRVFSILQKWPKMAKMTSDDLLTLKLALTELNLTKHSLSFLKFTVSVELERKNDFSGNIASYES